MKVEKHLPDRVLIAEYGQSAGIYAIAVTERLDFGNPRILAGSFFPEALDDPEAFLLALLAQYGDE